MKKSKEELTRIHKEKCRELKEIRAIMAENLGIELHQRECTYEGYCRGTCPACRKEEMLLNAALLRKQMEDANLKGRIAAAGLATAAALSLTGCNTLIQNETEGATSFTDEQSEGATRLEVPDGDIAGFITPESSECGITPLDESGENYVPALPGDNTMTSDQREEGEISPEIPENLGQPSYEMPGEYVELEGDVAYLPEVDEMENSVAD